MGKDECLTHPQSERKNLRPISFFNVIFFSRIPVLVFAIAVLTGATSSGAPPNWLVDGKLMEKAFLETDDGVVTLDWEPGAGTVELIHRKPNGRDWIQMIKKDTRSVMSGLDEGRHRFQLRRPGEDWGEVLTVECHYMERKKVVRLLVAGGVVVAIIVGAILMGSIRNREG